MRLHRLVLAAGLLLAAGCADDPGSGGPNACAAPETACGDACVDLLADVSSCGACGHACAAGDTCDHGSCVRSGCGEVRLPGPPPVLGMDRVWHTTVADLDGDETPDLVVGAFDGSANGLFLYPGHGDATFAAPIALLPTGPVNDVVVGNFDGAGLPDVAVTTGAPGEADGVTLLLRDHAGAVTTRHFGWRTLWRLAAGDLDGDGDLDLIACAVTGYDSSALRILRNDDGAFAWAGPEIGVAGRAADLALGDHDGDGDLDFFGPGDPNGAGWWQNQGDLAFARRWTVPVTLGILDSLAYAQGDLDRDGDLDLVTYGPTILWNRGDGTVPAVEGIDLGAVALDAAVVDLDADGDLDLVAGVREAGVYTLRVVRNQDGGLLPGERFAAVGYQLAVGDLDRDGRADVAVSQDNGPAIELLPGEGGTLRGRAFHGMEADVDNWLALADLDGSGTLRAIAVGDGTLGQVALPVGAYQDVDVPGAIGLAVGDLDGDGLPDVFTAQPDQDRLVLDPSGGVVTTMAVGDEPRSVALGDVDGDGLTDLLVAEGGPSPVLRVRWGRAFVGDGLYPLADLPDELVAGDLDGDGRDEVAIATRRWLQLVRTDAQGGLASAGLYDVWTVAPAIADLDDDGRGELFVPVRMAPEVRVLRLEAGGPVLAETIATTVAPITTVAADLDADGRLDLAVADEAGHVEVFSRRDGAFAPVGTWLGDGDASYVPSRQSVLAAADLDGDGRTDLAFLGPAGVYLLENGCGR